MIDQLLQRVEASDKDGAAALLESEVAKPGRAWAIHLALFPVVQLVINPPYINPHLPKMHGICREFLPYLAEEDLPALVRIEVNEYARRPKLEALPKPPGRSASPSFAEVEAAIREGDREKVAALLAGFLEQKGKAELARNLLILGSGYLDSSLGHAVSCTGFILLSMLERSDQDPWPTLTALAEYFCRGRFHVRPELRRESIPSEDLKDHLLRATSGSGIVDLHHTITRYAIERVRHLVSEAEYAHLLACWIAFLGVKKAEAPPPVPAAEAGAGYEGFTRHFSRRAGEETLASLAGMVASAQGRQQGGRYLIKGLCDLYQGDYNPHFLTGLGSALWVVEHYRNEVPLAINALRQYVNFFFSQLEGR